MNTTFLLFGKLLIKYSHLEFTTFAKTSGSMFFYYFIILGNRLYFLQLRILLLQKMFSYYCMWFELKAEVAELLLRVIKIQHK